MSQKFAQEVDLPRFRSDDYAVLISPQGVPDVLDRLILPDRKLLLPATPVWRPHPVYLQWHREHRFKA